MRYNVYPPISTQLETHREARCVVELTNEDLYQAVLLYAAQRDEYLPAGHAAVKPGRADGTFIMTIMFDPDEP